MKRLSLISVCLFIASVFAPDALAKEWRGIVPLHSTKEDVTRLFGTCDRNTGCQVRIGNEEAFFVFSNGTIGNTKCAKDLPPDTVLLIEVRLIDPPKLSALGISKSQFRTFDPSTPRNIGYKGYLDEKEGLVIKTYKGKVLQLDYIAAKNEVPLCPDYYDSPESFIQLLIEYCCPWVNLDCPSQAVMDGERVTISASTSASGRLKFRWQVTAGKIVAGQGTPKVTIDTTGVGSRVMTATVEMDDGSHHSTSTSCAISVSARPNN